MKLDAGRRRIAVVHFTGPPNVGGIERIMLDQVGALRALGVETRVIVGQGGAVAGAETVIVRALHPAYHSPVSSAAGTVTRFPDSRHPLVASIAQSLRDAVGGCDEVWVHNALTVYLNPFLTIALWNLIGERSSVRWTAWCEDVTATSAFQPSLTAVDKQRVDRESPAVTYVTISRYRRTELAAFLRVPVESIRVISPPVNVESWLDLSDETRESIRRLNLFRREPLVFVPSKLLPHKGLRRAVGAAAHLARRYSNACVLISGAASPHEGEVSAAVARELQDLSRGLDLGGVVYMLSGVLDGTASPRAIRELMGLADVVLVPSMEEGFGMPLREAALLRVPIVCTDIPVFREVAGEGARYFDPSDDDANIAEMIMEAANEVPNVARRVVIRSYGVFREQIRELIERKG